ncbi:hypothetical protein RHGRI_028399 [Rhododendron griersonianum]|uniref:Ribosomal protein S18 n=1 Tax=Rhododendron griersonianum TaxID=479676 RepID=A0AAV6IFP7_9ERIC|nr:hypothetical protein RHGRI_028399 [Rhododendron griersonianum]
MNLGSPMRPNHGGSKYVRMAPIRMRQMGRVTNQKLSIIFVSQKLDESYTPFYREAEAYRGRRRTVLQTQNIGFTDIALARRHASV